MANEYYIVLTDDPNFKEILALSTAFVFDKPRCSLNEKKAIIQLKDKQEPTQILDPYTPLTQAQAAEKMQGEEWQIIE